jgi:hypothetical protein
MGLLGRPARGQLDRLLVKRLRLDRAVPLQDADGGPQHRQKLEALIERLCCHGQAVQGGEPAPERANGLA